MAMRPKKTDELIPILRTAIEKSIPGIVSFAILKR